MSNTVQGKKSLKGQLLKNRFMFGFIALFVIALIFIISLTQLRLTNSSRFEVYEADKNYLIFIEFENNSFVPIKLKNVSIENDNPDVPTKEEINDWGIWIDNDSLLGAKILTDEELILQKQSNISNYFVSNKVKFSVFFRPAKDSSALSTGYLNQSIVIHYSVFGFQKEVKYKLNR